MHCVLWYNDIYNWSSTNNLNQEGRNNFYIDLKNHLYNNYLRYKNRYISKFIVFNSFYESYLTSKTKRYSNYRDDISRAKVFNSVLDAQYYILNSSFGRNQLEIKEIK